jgi:hypothetical protein
MSSLFRPVAQKTSDDDDDDDEDDCCVVAEATRALKSDFARCRRLRNTTIDPSLDLTHTNISNY